MSWKTISRITIITSYAVFVISSAVAGSRPGLEIGKNFLDFTLAMLGILPCAFILIGLFEVWVPRQAIEKHFGHSSGLRGYIWAILLSSSTVGGLYVAFPVAHSLYGKGARLSVIFTYVGAAAICRIPMTLFEASFMGAVYSLVRWLVSIPLIIISSMILGAYLERKGYRMSDYGKAGSD